MSRKFLTAIVSSAIYLGAAFAASAQVQTAVADRAAQAPAAQAPATSNSATPTQSLTPNKRRELIHRVLYAIYGKQGNQDAQEQELRELISLVPEDPVFHYLFGIQCMRQEKFKDAIQHFDDTEKVDPNYADAYAMEGECYAKQKKYKEAIEQYTLAQQHAKSGQNFKSQIEVNKQMLEKYEADQKYLELINKRKGK